MRVRRAAGADGGAGAARMEEDSAAVLDNVRSLRALLRNCQARIRELEAGRAVLSKTAPPPEPKASAAVEGLMTELHPGLRAACGRAPDAELPMQKKSSNLQIPCDGRPLQRASLLRQDEDSESNYVGSYGKLVSFLRAARSEDQITDDEVSELMSAVEDISRLGSGQAVRRQQPLFRGAQPKDFAMLLPSMGIELPSEGKSAPRKNSIRSSGNERAVSSSLKLGEEDVARSTKLLNDTWFNCRSRGDYQADANVVVHCFVAPFNLIERYSIDPNTLNTWVKAIADQYRPNAYHNWNHALDVFQFCYLALARGEAGDYFKFQDMLALLTATVAHDVGHPGVNNAFLVNTSNDVAITYNDKSPLENLHSSLCFQTLRRPGLNFLEDMPKEDYKVFRSKVIDAILATDMSHHFELVDRFTARVSTKESNPLMRINVGEDYLDTAAQTKEDRRMLMQAFTHMADLGHCCRPWDVHRHMVVALEIEFFEQGDKERELGMPVMPLMDRTKDSAAASQGFFLSKMVTPLLESFCVALKGDLGETLQENTAVNGYKWQGLIDKHGRLTATELIDKEDPENSPARALERRAPPHESRGRKPPPSPRSSPPSLAVVREAPEGAGSTSVRVPRSASPRPRGASPPRPAPQSPAAKEERSEEEASGDSPGGSVANALRRLRGAGLK